MQRCRQVDRYCLGAVRPLGPDDVQGQEVWRGVLTPGLTLDVTSWNPGTYFLATTDDQGHTLSRTLVVK